MRVKLSLLLAAFAGMAGAQVWEKPIAPGLVYRMEVDSATPRVIHALRFTPGSPTKAMVDLAGKTVYEENAAKGSATVSTMVLEQGAIAGLNGDFFPYTGDPLGAMVRSGELLSVPGAPRASFGWSNVEGAGAFGIMSFRGSFQANGSEVAIDNINGSCPSNGITLNTEAAAFSLCKAPNVHVVLKIDRADFSPNGTTTAIVQGMTADEATHSVPGGCAVLVAQGNKVTQLTTLRQGDKVVLRFQADGIDWRKVDQLISGGPFLLKEGNVWVDAEAEKFKDDFTKQRHPRTAVGRTSAGDFWFVAVDGRQSMSQGATIRELADLMMSLGCRDAINLDGGGSTDLNVFGVNVNRPSDGAERPVANGIFFFGPRPLKTTDPVTIEGPATLDIKGTATLRALEGSKPVADADVIWSAQGGAWIDQGGLLRPVKNGPAMITAWVKGNVVTKQIFVTGVVAKPRSAPVTSRGGSRKGTKKGGGG
jgi:hypothetical protein